MCVRLHTDLTTSRSYCDSVVSWFFHLTVYYSHLYMSVFFSTIVVNACIAFYLFFFSFIKYLYRV